jgi:hypothetical protein
VFRAEGRERVEVLGKGCVDVLEVSVGRRSRERE